MAKSETYALGERFIFTPKKGAKREGTVRSDRGDVLLVHLDGDPFAVDIAKDQCVPCKVIRNVVSSKTSTTTTRRRKSQMPTATEAPVTAKQLRLEAQGLAIEGYESMNRKELAAAIAAQSNGAAEKPARARRAKAAAADKPAKRTRRAPAEAAEEAPEPRKAARATKTPAKATAKPARKAAKAAPAAEATDPSSNPFRKGSNLHTIVPLLVKGGKRSVLASKLQAKVDLHHYSAGDDAASGPTDYDKRITLCATTLRDKHGWSMIQDGRGMSGWLQAVPPGGEMPTNRPNARVSTKA